jgi:sulfate permease, SulP family
LVSHFKNLKGDFLGGVTAGVVTLPLALAFGLQSGLGPVSGLYCAIILGLIAVVLGGTPTLISTPTGPMTSAANRG